MKRFALLMFALGVLSDTGAGQQPGVSVVEASIAGLQAAMTQKRITSRAIDSAGNVQPAMYDPSIADKKTYWEGNGQITRQIRIE